MQHSGNGGTSSHHRSRRNRCPFQNQAPASYPHPVAYRDGSRFVNYVSVRIPDGMKIGIHNQDVPRKHAVVTNTYLRSANHRRFGSNDQVPAGNQSCAFHHRNLAAMTYQATTFEYYGSGDIPDTPRFFIIENGNPFVANLNHTRPKRGIDFDTAFHFQQPHMARYQHGQPDGLLPR